MTAGNRICLALALALAGLAACASPRVGDEATVQFGVVRSGEEVGLDSTAAKGALIGGTLGLATGRRGSGVGNAIAGAAIGGATGAVAQQGDRRGMAFTVDLLDGSSTRIVTDQREIRPGDCVAVERVRDTANIRRTSEAYCNRANQRAVQAVQASARSKAVECRAAKQELVEARTEQQVDLASRKVELLCNS